MSAPWGSPEADILGDICEFMAWSEQLQRAAFGLPFVVLAPPPLGCPDCGMALPSCHQQHSREHCERHDLQVCRWARGEPDG